MDKQYLKYLLAALNYLTDQAYKDGNTDILTAQVVIDGILYRDMSELLEKAVKFLYDFYVKQNPAVLQVQCIKKLSKLPEWKNRWNLFITILADGTERNMQ